MIIAAVLLSVFLMLSIAFGAPPVPSHTTDVEAIIKWLRHKGLAQQEVVDLGSGTGKVVRKLNQAGIVAYGIEVNPILYLISRIRNHNILFGNYSNKDLSPYGVFYLFSSSVYLNTILNKIREYSPLCVLSYGFKLELDNYSEEVISGYYCYLLKK